MHSAWAGWRAWLGVPPEPMTMAAAAGVFGTGTVWPDVGVAALLAILGLTSGRIVIQQARAELRA